MDPRRYPRDQVGLPGAAVNLPDGQRGETGDNQDRDEVEGDESRDRLAPQGFCRASCGDIGIMFWSM